MWSKIGLAIALIGLLASAYFQFVVLEDEWKAERFIKGLEIEAELKTKETGEYVGPYDLDGYHEARDTLSRVTDVAIGLLGIGGLALLLCLLSLLRGDRKDRWAQVGAGLSLLPLILGIIHGTHMLS